MRDLKGLSLCWGIFVSLIAVADPVRVSEYFGFDPEDSTRFVQAALSSGLSEIVIDKREAPWFVRPLSARSNQTVLFEEGAVVMAKEGSFRDKDDVLLDCRAVTNLTLRGLGRGAVLKMRIADYQGPNYSHGEWRHALRLRGVDTVTVENLTFADSGGDGIYIGSIDDLRQTSRHVIVRDCVCDNNNRQGISVVSVDGLLIERTVMKNTRGTAPRSGIDFEPNLPWEKVSHIIMRDCLTENNAGAGYEFAINYLDETSEPPSILLENCRSVNDENQALKINYRRVTANLGQPKGGFLAVRNCLFKDNGSSGLTVEDKPLGVMDIVLENCTFEHCPRKASAGPTVRLYNGTVMVDPSDGVSFKDVTVVRETLDGWIRAETRPWDQVAVRKVDGRVVVKTPNAEHAINLDSAWRAQNTPAPNVRAPMANVPFDPARARVVDVCPGEAVAFPPIQFRRGVVAWVYAAKPGPISFTVRAVPLNRYPWTCDAFAVRYASGDVLGKLPRATERDETRVFQAPAAGFYQIFGKVRNASLVFSSCDAPIGFSPVHHNGHDLMKANGDLWFWKAAETTQSFLCSGCVTEFITAKLIDPDGRLVAEWKDTGAWQFRLLKPGDPEGLWHVRLMPPRTGLYYEDTNVELKGAPSVFFLTDKKYFSSK